MELFFRPGGQRCWPSSSSGRSCWPATTPSSSHWPPQPAAHLQKRAIVWGTVGAVVVRSTMTIGVVWLLKIPGLMLVGGPALVWIATSCSCPARAATSTRRNGTFWGAMKTIIVADALMGVDNVLGVAAPPGQLRRSCWAC